MKEKDRKLIKKVREIERERKRERGRERVLAR